MEEAEEEVDLAVLARLAWLVLPDLPALMDPMEKMDLLVRMEPTERTRPPMLSPLLTTSASTALPVLPDLPATPAPRVPAAIPAKTASLVPMDSRVPLVHPDPRDLLATTDILARLDLRVLLASLRRFPFRLDLPDPLDLLVLPAPMESQEMLASPVVMDLLDLPAVLVRTESPVRRVPMETQESKARPDLVEDATIARHLALLPDIRLSPQAAREEGDLSHISLVIFQPECGPLHVFHD